MSTQNLLQLNMTVAAADRNQLSIIDKQEYGCMDRGCTIFFHVTEKGSEKADLLQTVRKKGYPSLSCHTNKIKISQILQNLSQISDLDRCMSSMQQLIVYHGNQRLSQAPLRRGPRLSPRSPPFVPPGT